MKHTNKKGFTITELIIVIVVIAILAAVLIPTFISLVNKANQSVDIQAVRQMNTILKQDEITNGKPANIEAVKKVLEDNGISSYEPTLSTSVFAWDSEENFIVLIDKETQKGVFPKEYKDVEYKATWILLAGTINVTLDSDASLDEALENYQFGQTLVLSSDQTLTATELPKNFSVDINGHKLTLANGLPTTENGVIELSNGDLVSKQISIATGATVVLNEVDLTSTSSYAIHLSNHSSRLEVNGGSIIADVPVGTAYSDGNSRFVVANLNGATLGSADQPCNTGISMITSGDITMTDCVVYATEKCVYNRAGNVTIKNSTMNYLPTTDYVDTYLGNEGQNTAYAGNTPNNYKSWHWLGGTSGANAPIVVGDLRAKHYSYDANCVLENVTVNSSNSTYPDVYLSQERYDVFPWIAGSSPRKADFNNRVAGSVSVKTTLTCDSSIKWAVNPGNNSVFADQATGELAVYADCAGFEYSNSGHGGVAILYVDNVFVNGVEQAKGSTSTNPVPAN